MGVEQKHYVVFGVALTDPKDVKEANEALDAQDTDDIADQYHDRLSTKTPTPAPDGLNLILDYMNDEYVILGKIIQKNEECDGMGFTCIPEVVSDSKKIKEAIKQFDRKFGTKFSNKPIQYIVFTHFS